MNLKAGASYINDARCHDKIRVNRFQLPGQCTYTVGAEILGVANSDHVCVCCSQRIYHGSLVTKNGDRMSVDIDRIAAAGSPTRYANSSDTIARALHSLEFSCHGSGRLVGADYENSGEETAFRPFRPEPSPP
jgi:hypothetical protein